MSPNERVAFRICEGCDMPFVYEKKPMHHRRYCTETCRQEANLRKLRKEREPKNCVWCDAEFLDRSRSESAKFCSDICRNAAKSNRRAYGLSLEQYRELVNAGRCALCGEGPRGRMSIDHDHKTGRVRGWVHQQCNLIIAHVEDRWDKVEKAKAYLEAHG